MVILNPLMQLMSRDCAEGLLRWGGVGDLAVRFGAGGVARGRLKAASRLIHELESRL
jgi:hypothetical protein